MGGGLSIVFFVAAKETFFNWFIVSVDGRSTMDPEFNSSFSRVAGQKCFFFLLCTHNRFKHTYLGLKRRINLNSFQHLHLLNDL